MVRENEKAYCKCCDGNTHFRQFIFWGGENVFERIKISKINDHIWLLNDNNEATGYLVYRGYDHRTDLDAAGRKYANGDTSKIIK